jgi:DNA-binding GntR family transcriptional regulator
MSLTLAELKPETLRAQVENYLRDAITSGMLPAGQKLVERELCASMGVSRPSLREALRKLEAEKLIVQVPHRGPEVASITLTDARELFALRSILESFVAHEFTRLASDDAVGQLTRSVQRLQAAGLKKSRADVLRAKAEFYGVLYSGAGNTLVQEILGGLMSRISLLRSASLMRKDRLPSSIEEISMLLICIQNRDAVGAQEVSKKHVMNAEVAALAVFENQMNDLKKPSTSRRKTA